MSDENSVKKRLKHIVCAVKDTFFLSSSLATSSIKVVNSAFPSKEKAPTTDATKEEESVLSGKEKLTTLLDAYDISYELKDGSPFINGKKIKNYSDLMKSQENNLESLMKTYFIAAALKKEYSFKTQTIRGIVSVDFSYIDRDHMKIMVNGKEAFSSLPTVFLKNPKDYEKMTNRKLISDILTSVDNVLSEKRKITKDISIAIDRDKNISFYKNGIEVFHGNPKFDDFLRFFPDQMEAKALYSVYYPEKFALDFIKVNGEAYLKIKEYSIDLRKPVEASKDIFQMQTKGNVVRPEITSLNPDVFASYVKDFRVLEEQLGGLERDESFDFSKEERVEFHFSREPEQYFHSEKATPSLTAERDYVNFFEEPER